MSMKKIAAFIILAASPAFADNYGPQPLPPIVTSVPYLWTGAQTFKGGLIIYGCSGPVVGNGGSAVSCQLITGPQLASGAAALNLGYTPLNPANNLSDVPNKTAAVANLGLSASAPIGPDQVLLNATAGTAAATGQNVGNCSFGLTYSTTAHAFGCLSSAAVTSVGLSLPAIFTVTGSPVTSSGTLTATYVSQNANTIFAGPTSGTPAWPTFRSMICADLPAGSKCLLNTMTASNSASLSDTTSFLSGYSEYEIVFENIIPATNAVQMVLRVQSGGVFQASSYQGAATVTNTTSGANEAGTALTTLPLGRLNPYVANLAPGLSGTVRVSNPAQTSAAKMFTGHFGQIDTSSSNQIATISSSGFWSGGSGALTGFEVLASSGNITSGVIKVYGWN